MPRPPTRLVLLDDHAMVRQGIQRLLEDSGQVEVVGQAESVAETMIFLKTDLPDLIVANINLPDEEGLALLTLTRGAGQHVPVLFFSVHQDPRLVARALDEGARGLLPKSAPVHDLLVAIQEVQRGGTYIHPCLSGPLFQWMNRSCKKDSLVENLSKREVEVLRLASGGLRNREIAEALNLSVSTIKFHLRETYGKIRAKGRAHALLIASKLGLLAGLT